MKNFFKTTFRFIGALLALVRGIMLLGMLFIGIMTIYLIHVAANVTIDQYNESLTWENTAYDMPRSEIEPALVSNVVDMDVKSAAAAWENLEKYVYSLDGKSIPDREMAEEILKEAVHWQEIYGLKSDSITRLSLYLELEDAILDAYDTLDTEQLQELSWTLHNLELEEPTDAGQEYMERLKAVSADFTEAENMMTETVWSIGTVKDGIWTIPYTCTRTDLTAVLEQLQTMQKFPAICNAADVLSDISVVLDYNKNAREYFQYQQFKETIADWSRSQYSAVSSISTYKQAMDFGCEIQANQLDGYTISPDSTVEGIYYEGYLLDESDYVRNGAPLTAVINEIYEQIPTMPESPVYENPEPIEQINEVFNYE